MCSFVVPDAKQFGIKKIQVDEHIGIMSKTFGSDTYVASYGGIQTMKALFSILSIISAAQMSGQYFISLTRYQIFAGT